MSLRLLKGMSLGGVILAGSMLIAGPLHARSLRAADGTDQAPLPSNSAVPNISAKSTTATPPAKPVPGPRGSTAKTPQ